MIVNSIDYSHPKPATYPLFNDLLCSCPPPCVLCRLLQLCQRTMALPVGRGLFTLFSYHPVPTEPLPVPKLNLTGNVVMLNWLHGCWYIVKKNPTQSMWRFSRFLICLYVSVSVVAPRPGPTKKHYGRSEQREHRRSSQHDQLAQLP